MCMFDDDGNWKEGGKCEGCGKCGCFDDENEEVE